MSRKVALTGTSGFIGQAMANRLCQAGFKVRGLARSSNNPSSINHPHMTQVLGSLDNVESLRRLLEGCTDIVHCAGAIRGSKKDDFFATNVTGVSNLVKACLSQPSPPRLIHLSSLAAREPSLSPYAWSKREGELVIQERAGPLNWIIIRPPAVYGPQDKALLPLFRLAKKGIALQLGPRDGKFSFIHVQDLTEVVLRSLENYQTHSTLFEVDDGFSGGYTWESVFRLINPQMKLHLAIPPKLLWCLGKSNEILSRMLRYTPLFTTGKVAELCHPNWVCDAQEARQQLQWSPQIPLAKGLRDLFTSDSLS